MSNTPNFDLREILENMTDAARARALNESFLLVDKLLAPGVIDRDLTSPPGSPAQGALYIVASAGASGAWSGQEDTLAFYYNGWIHLDPMRYAELYVIDEATWIVWDGSAWITSTRDTATPEKYDIGFNYGGNPASAGELLGRVVVPRDVDFAANFAGSYGYVQTNPAASFVISVADDGGEIGTITISTGGSFTFATSGGTAKTVLAGSRLDFLGPDPADGTIASIAATLAGLS